MDQDVTSAPPLRTPCGRTFERAITLFDQRHMFGANTSNGKSCYRGREFLKLPLDVLIYMQLLHKARPATIIEIGSKDGGSALWFADMMGAVRRGSRVVSVDLKAPQLKHKRILFLEGDATDLGAVLTEELLAELPRPWLISEDSAHVYKTTKAVLDFFKPRLGPGEYFVIEDGVVGELGPRRYAQYDNGVNRAVADFLTESPEFEVDAELCDFFGYNVTGNPNGYIRRKLAA